MKAVSLAALAAVALAAPAVAKSAAAAPVDLSRMTEGYSYFNRPGADRAIHDQELTSCIAQASRTRSIDEQIGNGGLIGGLLTDIANNGVRAAATENCMIVRGWRVVSLPKAEGAALAALAPAELGARLEPWIGAEMPHGAVVRSWGNDAARATTTRFAIRPGYTKNGSLSVTALGARTLAAEFAAPPPPAITLDPIWPTKPLQPAELGAIPPGAAVLIVEAKGGSMGDGMAVTFMRAGPTPDTFASALDHGPDLLRAVGPKKGKIYALAVPPGRWRIASLGIMPVLNFCLGAPSFEVTAGEVVYAGSFDLASENLAPNLDLAPAKALLAGQPAAEKVRAAAYTNGSVGMCGDNGLYALEIEGAPYEPGYRWGGAASAGR